MKTRTFEASLKDMMKDPVFRAEYIRLEPEYAVIEAMNQARIKKGISQAEIAKKMGTTQSAISRTLSGSVSPSLKFLQRFAKAIDAELKIQFI